MRLKNETEKIARFFGIFLLVFCGQLSRDMSSDRIYGYIGLVTRNGDIKSYVALKNSIEWVGEYVVVVLINFFERY